MIKAKELRGQNLGANPEVNGQWTEERRAEYLQTRFKEMTNWVRTQFNTDLAEDVVQEANIKVLANWELDPYTQQVNFNRWYYKIVRFTAIDFYRKQITKKNSGISLEEILNGAESIPANLPSPEDTAIDVQLWDKILKIIPLLEEGDRKILLLDLEGHKDIEIAEILKIPVGTIKSSLHRTKKEVKRLFYDPNFPNNGHGNSHPNRRVSLSSIIEGSKSKQPS